MGILHMRCVYAVPAGYLTADERLVLLVLADQTPDFHQADESGEKKVRMEWVHDRRKLMPALGLDPDSGKDHEWLRRRLSDLEKAGFIRRRPQRRHDKRGTWARQSIRLEDHFVGSWGYRPIGLYFEDEGVTPTVRAARGDGRAALLPRSRSRDERGRFTTDRPTETVGRYPTETVGRPPHANGGDHPTETVGLNSTTRQEKLDKNATLAPDGAEVDFEARRLQAKRGLAALAKEAVSGGAES